MPYKKPLSRRTFLHGMRYTLGLPLLDAMIPSFSSGQSLTPKRFLSYYMPNGSYMGNMFTGRNQGLWNSGAGTLTAANVPLALRPMANYFADMMIINNLNNTAVAYSEQNFPNYRNYPAPQGLDLDDLDYILPYGHGQRGSSFLTCAPGIRDSVGKFLTARVGHDSFDQILVTDLKNKGRWNGRSFVANITSITNCAKNDATTEAYGLTNSYLNGSPVFPMYKTSDVMSNFFLGVGGGSGNLPKIYDRSHLSSMRESIASLKAELGNSDRRILSEYLDEVRALEILADQVAAGGGTCSAIPAGPTSAPTRGAKIATDHVTNFGKFLMKAIYLGMKCDRIRSGVAMLGSEPTGLDYGQIIPASCRYSDADLTGEYHLETAHHKNNAANIKRLISIHYFQLSFIKQLVDDLASATEPGGTMLDNTIIMGGPGLGDGDRHSVNDMVRVFFGGKNLGLNVGKNLNLTAQGDRNVNGPKIAEIYLGLLGLYGVTATSYGANGGRATNAFNLRA